MLNVEHIVQSGGLLLIAAMIFAESGMFVGFFFPGDTLLLTAGIFAAQGRLPLVLTMVVVAAAAITGDNVGYQIGRRYGRSLFKKPDGLVFKQSYVQRAETFYEKWGSKTMLVAHFVPVVRSFAPAVAGVAKMDYKRFMAFDAIGDIAWTVIVIMIGYWVGTKIPNVDQYILFAVFAVVAITLGPTLYHVSKALLEKQRKTKSETKKSE